MENTNPLEWIKNKKKGETLIIASNEVIPFDALNWIKHNEDILSIYKIEKLLEMPEGTLTKAVKGSRSLPKKWQAPLNEFIKSRIL